MNDLFIWDLPRLMELADAGKEAYARAAPFPHIVIDRFLPEEAACRLYEEFPQQGSPVLKTRNMPQQPGKFGSLNAENLTLATPYLQHFFWALNAYPMLAFLSRLTGIDNLLADPYFSGGGLHQIVAGGHLDVHADFSFDERIKLYRRLNVLIYLNPIWNEKWGGELELWDRDMSRCVKSIAPEFNRCVIFTTSPDSFHGHPRPLSVPPGITRNSIATYYYTAEPPEGGGRHPTLWQKRPGF